MGLFRQFILLLRKSLKFGWFDTNNAKPTNNTYQLKVFTNNMLIYQGYVFNKY